MHLELRDAATPSRSRDIAQSIIALKGDDARDRRYLSDLTKRVSKALRALRDDGLVSSAVDLKGNVAWAIKNARGTDI
jgi:hypothetical protein